MNSELEAEMRIMCKKVGRLCIQLDRIEKLVIYIEQLVHTEMAVSTDRKHVWPPNCNPYRPPYYPQGSVLDKDNPPTE